MLIREGQTGEVFRPVNLMFRQFAPYHLSLNMEGVMPFSSPIISLRVYLMMFLLSYNMQHQTVCWSTEQWNEKAVRGVFHSHQVLVSNWRQSILAEVFPQFLQTNAGILTLIGWNAFPSMSFPICSSLTIQYYSLSSWQQCSMKRKPEVLKIFTKT